MPTLSAGYAALGLGAASLLSAAAGFLLQLLIARYFGASAATDAFFMAQSTSELLSKILLGGSLASVLLPMLVERLTHQKTKEAGELFWNTFWTASLLFVLLLIPLALFTKHFVGWIAPGFSPETAALTTRLLRLMLPAFLFAFLTQVTVAALHARREFTLPAFLRLTVPVISMVLLLAAVRYWKIYTLAIGMLIGSGIQLTFLLWKAWRDGLPLAPWRPLDPALKRLLILLSPFILSVLATQGAGIIWRILVSGLPAGSLAALKFAEKIFQLLNIIFITTATTIAFPAFSTHLARVDFSRFMQSLRQVVRFLLFITLPVSAAVMIVRSDLIYLLYQRGAFDQGATKATSAALLFFMLGLAPNGISALLGHAVLAQKATKVAVGVTIFSQAVAIFLFWLLIKPLGHAGLALAASLVPLSIIAGYATFLAKRIPPFRKIWRDPFYLQVGVLVLIAAVVMQVVLRIFPSAPLPPLLASLCRLALTVGSGAGLYLFLASLWRLPEAYLTWQLLSNAVKWLKLR